MRRLCWDRYFHASAWFSCGYVPWRTWFPVLLREAAATSEVSRFIAALRRSLMTKRSGYAASKFANTLANLRDLMSLHFRHFDRNIGSHERHIHPARDSCPWKEARVPAAVACAEAEARRPPGHPVSADDRERDEDD